MLFLFKLYDMQGMKSIVDLLLHRWQFVVLYAEIDQIFQGRIRRIPLILDSGCDGVDHIGIVVLCSDLCQE